MRIQEVVVRNVRIGAGMPKICIPIVGTTQEEIFAQAEQLRELPCDMAEWRIDWFAECRNKELRRQTAEGLRRILGELPVIATLRTKREGGKMEVEFPLYTKINLDLARSGYVDMIDVEAYSFGEISEELIQELHKEKQRVIVSNHDFRKTPPKEEIVNRLLKMQEIGADIVKLAVMPQSARDVLELMAAVELMNRELASVPIIAVSMSGLGAVSRLAGEFFGSAVTFASAGMQSAPGQLSGAELRSALELLHRAL